MATDGDSDDEEQAPAVELGDGDPVTGAPLARVASRLTWPIERSEIERLEGTVVIRTPDGGQELADLLADVDHTYFATRQEFVSAVRDVAGVGPVPTE